MANQIDGLKGTRIAIREHDPAAPLGSFRDDFTLSLLADEQEKMIQQQLKFMRQAGCLPPESSPRRGP